jgi:hypothetical protein
VSHATQCSDGLVGFVASSAHAFARHLDAAVRPPPWSFSSRCSLDQSDGARDRHSHRHVSDRLKEDYNRATPADAARFAPEIEKSLGLYDGFEGMANENAAPGPSFTTAHRRP